MTWIETRHRFAVPTAGYAEPMGYKLLGYAVWHGVKRYLRRRYGRYVPSRRVAAAGMVAMLVGGSALLAARRTRQSV